MQILAQVEDKTTNLELLLNLLQRLEASLKDLIDELEIIIIIILIIINNNFHTVSLNYYRCKVILTQQNPTKIKLNLLEKVLNSK